MLTLRGIPTGGATYFDWHVRDCVRVSTECWVCAGRCRILAGHTGVRFRVPPARDSRVRYERADFQVRSRDAHHRCAGTGTRLTDRANCTGATRSSVSTALEAPLCSTSRSFVSCFSRYGLLLRWTWVAAMGRARLASPTPQRCEPNYIKSNVQVLQMGFLDARRSVCEAQLRSGGSIFVMVDAACSCVRACLA